MRLRHSSILLAAMGIVLAGTIGCGEDVEKLARIGRRAAINLREATDEARGTVARGWESIQGGEGLQSRVESRLRWDKDLVGTGIEVVVRDGVVELKGEVADGLKRQRAVEVARNTRGVEKVVDSLSQPRP